MATAMLQRLDPFQETQSKSLTGAVTGNVYIVDQLGRVTVDTRDALALTLQGWLYILSGSTPTSGVATLDFGAFPGSPMATVTVPSIDSADPNAEIDAWVIPVATTDHSADEHIADPPRVIAAIVSGNIVISGFPSGRDLPVPPGTPFGNTAGSQMPIASQQCMPYGKWSVAWAFSP
jgi:hypothetical protein